MTTTRIAHISDPHIVERGDRLGGIVDTATNLRAAVHHINAMQAPVDAVLVTGDLTNDGRADQYDHLVELMAPLDAPWHAILGNHDEDDDAGAALGEHLVRGGPRPGSGVLDIGEVTVLALSSARYPESAGSLDAGDLEWADGILGRLDGLDGPGATSRPTLVALHHPPMAVGLRAMDTMRLDDESSKRLAEVVEQHHVDAVICGHLHRMTMTPYAGTIAISAPSIAFSVAFDLSDAAPLAGSFEPTSMLVHLVADGTLTTHLSIIGDFPTRSLA